MNLKKKTLSSIFLFTNFVHLFFKNDIYYLYSFALLFLSSIFYHETKNNYVLFFDWLFVYNVAIYGAIILFYNGKFDIYTSIIVICFLLNIFLLYFQRYLIYKNKNTNTDNYHCLLHFIGSIGHHFIINML